MVSALSLSLSLIFGETACKGLRMNLALGQLVQTVGNKEAPQTPPACGGVSGQQQERMHATKEKGSRADNGGFVSAEMTARK